MHLIYVHIVEDICNNAIYYVQLYVFVYIVRGYTI